MRGATYNARSCLFSMRFQSTHLMRGATLIANADRRFKRFQSTHLMRGATYLLLPSAILTKNFNPRTSCEVRPFTIFGTACTYYFNPRTSCEVRHLTPNAIKLIAKISIHAPHARCDASFSFAVVVRSISIHAPHARCDI